MGATMTIAGGNTNGRYTSQTDFGLFDENWLLFKMIDFLKITFIDIINLVLYIYFVVI